MRSGARPADLAAGQGRIGAPTAECEELRRLRREVKVLPPERDLLTPVAACSAREPAAAARLRAVPAGKADAPAAVRWRVLGVSRADSSAKVHRTPSHRAAPDAILTQQMRRTPALSRGAKGAPRLHASLVAAGRPRGVVCLMRRTGNGRDNAVAESCCATLPTERIDRPPCPTQHQVRAAVFAWIEVFSNRQRPHFTLGYVSPAEFAVPLTGGPVFQR